jgi:hypothetical protein
MRTIEAVKVVNHLILSSTWKTAVFSVQIQMRLRWEGGKNSLGATVWNKILGFDQSDAEKLDSFCKKWRAYYPGDSWLFHLLDVKVSGCVKGSMLRSMESDEYLWKSLSQNSGELDHSVQHIEFDDWSSYLQWWSPYAPLFRTLLHSIWCKNKDPMSKQLVSVLSSKWLFPHTDGGSPGVLAALWIAIFQPGQMNSILWPGQLTSGWLHWSMC